MSTYDIIKIIVGLIVLFIIGMYVGGLVYQATGCCDYECEEDLSCYTQIDFPCGEDVRAFDYPNHNPLKMICRNNQTWVKLNENTNFVVYYGAERNGKSS